MLNIVILAAGQGKRMQSNKPKVMHTIAGRPMLAHVLDSAQALNPDEIVVVVGHGAELVQKAFSGTPNIGFALQQPQLGTGHAVLQAVPLLKEDGKDDVTLVLYGDVPLVQPETLRALLAARGKGIAVLTEILDDPAGYVISVMMVAFSILALWLSSRVLKGRDYTTLQKGGTALARRTLSPWEGVLAYGWIILVLMLVLSPHVGVLLLSFASVWSYAPLPDGFTLEHYASVFEHSRGMMANTLLYCSLAAGVDVVLGTTIAYIMLRTRLPGRQWLDWIASAALAIPGLVLAIGYLRTFRGVFVPGTDIALTSTWVLIMIAYAVRRLPYALRSCVAALQQVAVSLEEAAESLGAGRLRTIRRIVIPLMTGGMLAGFVTSFITAAVELSATLMLVTKESQAPMSYGIYLYMQSTSGRGPGAALGVLAVVAVALGTYASHWLVARQGRDRQTRKPEISV